MVAVTPLLPEDWPALRAIYADGMATGLATFETSPPEWETWDRSHLAVGRLAAREQDVLLGWAALSPVSARKAYAGVAEVSIYVARQARGCGVGRALLLAVIAAAEEAGFWTLQAVIFAGNAPSLALHRACGFREVGRRERIAMRDGVWHDTILLERRSRVVGV